ncbi:hypothetical protein CHU98_g11879 [Xylaria longipes]|nr:hypothetical protein CHU98_g11879 [Xylaria longipes]
MSSLELGIYFTFYVSSRAIAAPHPHLVSCDCGSLSRLVVRLRLLILISSRAITAPHLVSSRAFAAPHPHLDNFLVKPVIDWDALAPRMGFATGQDARHHWEKLITKSSPGTDTRRTRHNTQAAMKTKLVMQDGDTLEDAWRHPRCRTATPLKIRGDTLEDGQQHARSLLYLPGTETLEDIQLPPSVRPCELRAMNVVLRQFGIDIAYADILVRDTNSDHFNGPATRRHFQQVADEITYQMSEDQQHALMGGLFAAALNQQTAMASLVAAYDANPRSSSPVTARDKLRIIETRIRDKIFYWWVEHNKGFPYNQWFYILAQGITSVLIPTIEDWVGQARPGQELRLTCKQVEPAACAALFRRIALSCLTSNRDSIFQIVARSDLARHVREIAWLTLDCKPEPRSRIEAVLADFGPKFFEAAGSLTGLRSVVRQHMPAERVVARLPSAAGGYGGYPITADILEVHSFEKSTQSGETRMRCGRTSRQPGKTSAQPEYEVFSRVLLPYVAHKDSGVCELGYDSRSDPLPMHRLFGDCSSATPLTSITLAFNLVRPLKVEPKPPIFDDLAFARRFLSTATGLKRPNGQNDFYHLNNPDDNDDLDDYDSNDGSNDHGSFDEDEEDYAEYEERYKDYTNDKKTCQWACEATKKLWGRAFDAEKTLYTETLLLRYFRNEIKADRIENSRGDVAATHTRVFDDGEGYLSQDDARSERTSSGFPSDEPWKRPDSVDRAVPVPEEGQGFGPDGALAAVVSKFPQLCTVAVSVVPGNGPTPYAVPIFFLLGWRRGGEAAESPARGRGHARVLAIDRFGVARVGVTHVDITHLNVAHVGTTNLVRCEDCGRSRGRCVRSQLGSTVELLWRLSPPPGALQWKELRRCTFGGKGSQTEAGGPQAAADTHLDAGGQQPQTSAPATTAAYKERLRPRRALNRSGDKLTEITKPDLYPHWKWGVFFPRNSACRPWETKHLNNTYWSPWYYDIYYWRTQPGEPGGSPTQVWRFGKGANVCYGHAGRPKGTCGADSFLKRKSFTWLDEGPDDNKDTGSEMDEMNLDSSVASDTDDEEEDNDNDNDNDNNDNEFWGGQRYSKAQTDTAIQTDETINSCGNSNNVDEEDDNKAWADSSGDPLQSKRLRDYQCGKHVAYISDSFLLPTIPGFVKQPQPSADETAEDLQHEQRILNALQSMH